MFKQTNIQHCSRSPENKSLALNKAPGFGQMKRSLHPSDGAHEISTNSNRSLHISFPCRHLHLCIWTRSCIHLQHGFKQAGQSSVWSLCAEGGPVKAEQEPKIRTMATARIVLADRGMFIFYQIIHCSVSSREHFFSWMKSSYIY